MRNRLRWLLVLLPLALGLLPCGNAGAETPYKTKNVIIVSMDGVRYSETFGDPQRELIPEAAKLEKEGTLYTDCLNTGVTITRQGHSTIATGTWQDVPLGGPRQTMPTVAEYARNELGWPQKDCWVIFGKGMYSYAHFGSFPNYGEKYAASFIIAIGENSIADDEKVLAKVLEVMDTDKPRLMFINFGVTDHTGHSNKWELYTEAIQHCDKMVGQLWEKAQSTPGYKDATTLVFTTDHGRHNDKPDQLHGGFASHGDSCPGCQHVMLLIVGPDARPGAVIDRRALQVDIAPTVGELLGFQTPLAEGDVLADCFVECRHINTKAAKTPEAEKALALVKLSKRDLLAVVADASLKRPAADLAPSAATEALMRGMIRAAQAANNAKYREFVAAWAKQHMEQGDQDPCVARVLAELAASGGPAEYLAAAKRCAEKLAQQSIAKPAGQGEAPCQTAGFLARVAELTKDEALAQAAKARLGLEGKTEKDLLAEWQKLKLRPAPMACDFGPKPPAQTPATMADALRFMALADAARAMPEDRVVRLALNIQEAACSRGIREIGGVQDDPLVAAIVLGQVLEARKINRQHPIQWVEPAAPGAKPKPGAPAGPLWANPDPFYQGAFPYGFNLLKYQVSEEGHYAGGCPLADGAALVLFAATAGMPMRGALGPSQVVELPAVPPGCTRVIVEFGNSKQKQLFRWHGTIAVENGELVAVHPYLLEPDDKLDAAARTFDCHAGPATDGLALDIRGTDQTLVKITCQPQGMTFTLGDVKEKKTIEVPAPGEQMLRAMLRPN